MVPFPTRGIGGYHMAATRRVRERLFPSRNIHSVAVRVRGFLYGEVGI
jgi:hypothetical protein